MHVRINFRFLGILILAAGVIAAGAFGVHHLQVSRNADWLLQRARQTSADGDLLAATRHYNRYLQIVEDSAEVHAELGDVWRRLGNARQAYFSYETAIRFDGSRDVVRRQLAEAAIALERTGDAAEHLQRLLEGDPQHRGELLWMLGICQEDLGQYQAARESWEQAVEEDPQNPWFAGNLAHLLRRRFSQAEAAREVLDALIERATDDALAWYVRGQWLAGRAPAASGPLDRLPADRLEAAWSDGQTALRLASEAHDRHSDTPDPALSNGDASGEPSDRSGDDRRPFSNRFSSQRDAAEWIPQIVSLMADLAMARGRPGEAYQAVEQAVDDFPRVAELYNKAAELELRMSGPEAASEWLRRGLSALPSHADLTWSLAQVQLDAGQLEVAAELLEQLRIAKYPAAPRNLLQAQLSMRQGEWQRAESLLEEARALYDPENEKVKQVELLQAACYQQLGDSERELSAIRRALAIDPDWLPGRQALADALLRADKIDAALSEYRLVADHRLVGSESTLGLARALLLRAEQATDNESAQAIWDELERVVERLEDQPQVASGEAAEGQAEARVLRAELIYARQGSEAAEQSLRDAIDARPSSGMLHGGLISLFLRTQRWEEAQTAIDEAVRQCGDAPAWRIARARVEMLQQGPDVSVERLDTWAQPAETWNATQDLQLARSFAAFFASLDAWPRCQQQATRVVESRLGRYDPRMHQLLLDSLARQGDLAEMQQAVNRIRQMIGEDALWHVGRAMTLQIQAEQTVDDSSPVERSRLLAEASEQLDEAAVLKPGWPSIPKLKGHLLELQGQPALAVQKFVEAIDLGARDSALISQTLRLLFEQRRFETADRLARELEQRQMPLGGELARLASRVSLELENYPRAIELASQATAESQMANDHAWLGQVYALAGRYQDAEKEFRRAIEVEPNNPVGWVALVQMLVRRDQRPRAQAVIKEAGERLAEESAEATLAQCLEAIGEDEQAEEAYLRAIDRERAGWQAMRRLARFYLRRDRTDDARPWLQRLVDAETPVESENPADSDEPGLAMTEVDRRWARRQLALDIVRQGDRRATERALELLDPNLQQPPVELEDRRAQALILAGSQDQGQRRQAIDLLTGVIEEQAEFAMVEHVALADLYLALDEISKYRQTMRKVLTQGGADIPQVVQAYTRALIRLGDVGEASAWFERLQRLQPEAESTREVHARLLFALEAYEQLRELLSDAAASEAGRQWAIDGAEYFAHRLEQLERNPLANTFEEMVDRWYGRWAEEDPSQQADRAAMLAKRGEIDDAIALAQMAKLEAEPVAEIVLSGLHAENLTSQQARSLIAWARPIYDANPESPRLRIGLGDLYSWVGDWQHAREVYERVLEEDPGHLSALNNLAMTLALSGERLDRAYRAIETAVEHGGEQAYLLDTRGLVHLATGAYPQAEQDFRRVLASSISPEVVFHLARALTAQGKTAEARTVMEQARKAGLSANDLHPLERQLLDAFQ